MVDNPTILLGKQQILSDKCFYKRQSFTTPSLTDDWESEIF